MSVTEICPICQRQPVWKRVALRFTTSSSLGFDVWQSLLSVPADELADQIRRYAETHAPPGFLEEEGEEDDTEAAPSPAEWGGRDRCTLKAWYISCDQSGGTVPSRARLAMGS